MHKRVMTVVYTAWQYETNKKLEQINKYQITSHVTFSYVVYYIATLTLSICPYGTIQPFMTLVLSSSLPHFCYRTADQLSGRPRLRHRQLRIDRQSQLQHF